MSKKEHRKIEIELDDGPVYTVENFGDYLPEGFFKVFLVSYRENEYLLWGLKTNFGYQAAIEYSDNTQEHNKLILNVQTVKVQKPIIKAKVPDDWNGSLSEKDAKKLLGDIFSQGNIQEFAFQ